jgi:N-acetyltransferase 10
MNDPIRYSAHDPIENWINTLLLLEATQAVPLKKSMPHPNDCELYLVNRDTLFAYKKTTEEFLFNLMSLFISSHYKNSPNDLQLLSDAPAHAIFVLLQSIEKK